MQTGLHGTFQTLSVSVACFGGDSQGHFHIFKKRLAQNKGIKIIKVKLVITIKKTLPFTMSVEMGSKRGNDLCRL